MSFSKMVMDLSKSNKISIVGNSAAGKSTLSVRLGEALGREVFSVDKIYWLSGWQQRDLPSFKALHDQWLARAAWIIEGIGHWEALRRRLDQSDYILFLDPPITVCKARAEARIKQERWAQNPHVTPGCVYADAKELQMETIDYFHHSLRPSLIDYLSNIDAEKIKVIRDADLEG